MHIHPYQFPLKKPFTTAGQQISTREGRLLEWHSDTTSVWSECAPLPGFSPESLSEVDAWLEQHHETVTKYLRQQHNLSEITALREAPASVRFAISSLWYSLQAESAGQPLFRYLSERAQKTLPVNGIIAATEVDQCLGHARRLIDRGYKTLKIKTGFSFNREYELLKTLRSQYPDLNLRIDANRAWNFHQAAAVLREMEGLNIEYCEEPLKNPTFENLAKLRRKSTIPLAADESLRSSDDARQLIEARAADIFILKPMLIGSIEEIREIALEANRHQINCVVTTTLESGVGRLITAHIAAALGTTSYASGLATGHLLTEDALPDDAFLHNGTFHLPTEAGSGAYPRNPVL